MIVIFTILIGGSLDILGLVLDLLVSLVKFIMKMRKRYNKSKPETSRLKNNRNIKIPKDKIIFKLTVEKC